MIAEQDRSLVVAALISDLDLNNPSKLDETKVFVSFVGLLPVIFIC
jgi:hypothetical protein